MKPRTFFVRGLLILIATGAPAADAARITIEPDNYAPNSDISSVGPGAVLFTYLRHPTAFAPIARPVLAVPFGWPVVGGAPTGTQLFGHSPLGGTVEHWAGLVEANECRTGIGCRSNFYVFVALFDSPTSYVELKTAILPWANDGAELWAFDSEGRRIAECNVHGIDHEVLRTGVLPNPVYGTRLRPAPVPRVLCGKVTRRSYCELGTDPGECRYDVTAWIRRPSRDIAFVMWGGVFSSDSTSPIDALRYEF